jgi:hypothetical protein
MENKSYREIGTGLAQFLLVSFEPVFFSESFYNAPEVKVWLGQSIKFGHINGYKNLNFREYKFLVDLTLRDGSSYHVGVDFGQQAVHVTLGPGDVYSLYFRNPCGHE